MKTKVETKPLLFGDQPLFGLDIGDGELRVVQVDLIKGQKPRLRGYGSIGFDPGAIEHGVIAAPEVIAKAAFKLFSKELIGEITTKRVAVSLPSYRALTRALQLPKLSRKDIDDAVKAEAAQYIPIQKDNSYLDYTTLRESEEGLEIFMVAMPREVVDSHLALARLMGLEPILFDTTIGASAHLYTHDRQSAKVPSVLVDIDTTTTDITIFNRGLVVTGTVPSGGDDVSVAIARALRVTPSEALMLKSKYGLAESVFHKQITAAVEAPLALLLKEIRRTIRYYEQRYAKDEPIGQVVIMGGGANMPGLTDYFAKDLKLSARAFDPSEYIDFGHMPSFYADRMSYATATGLAVINPAEVFA